MYSLEIDVHIKYSFLFLFFLTVSRPSGLIWIHCTINNGIHFNHFALFCIRIVVVCTVWLLLEFNHIQMLNLWYLFCNLCKNLYINYYCFLVMMFFKVWLKLKVRTTQQIIQMNKLRKYDKYVLVDQRWRKTSNYWSASTFISRFL